MNHDALRTKPTLVGDRVRLVPLGPEHTSDLHASISPENRRLTGTHQTFTLEVLEQWCASRADQPNRLDLAVLDADDSRFVGELVLNDVDPDNLSANLRIALAHGSGGRGLGSEAIRLVLDHAFDQVGLNRVSLEVFVFNERAIAAYRKCGFVEEGRLRQRLRWDGEWHDALVMSVVASDRTERWTAD